jgi:hypothetical protein
MGEVVVGGGFFTSTNNVDIRESQKNGNGWSVKASGSGSGGNLQAFAECLSLVP